MNTQRKEKGFTIIEVVLVLAIAGLIFLMVFIALPALQRSQRDTQRKNDLSRAITAVTSYASNNRGALPGNDNADWEKFANSYLRAGSSDGSGDSTKGADSFNDPTGANYAFSVNSGVTPTYSSETPTIYVTVGSTCNGESLVSKQGNRKVALQMKLEGGGIACQSN